jgi:hypothetical protein
MNFLENSLLNNNLFKVFQAGGSLSTQKELIKKICIFCVFILLILEIAQPLSKVSQNFKSGTPMALAITTSFIATAMVIIIFVSMYKPSKLLHGILIFNMLLFYIFILTMTITGKPDLSKSGQAYLYIKLMFYFGVFAALIASMISGDC